MSTDNFKATCVKGLALIGAACIAAPVLAGLGISVAPVLSAKALAIGAVYCTTAVASTVFASASAAAGVAWAMGIIEPLCGPDGQNKGAALTVGSIFMIPAALAAAVLSLPFAHGVGSACAGAVASLM